MLTEEFLTELRLRATSAKFIPFRVVRFKNGEPQPNACHTNVEDWIKENPQHKPVQGWLVTSGFLLDAHSVVADDSGTLFDITPVQTPWRPPFLPHLGNDAEFKELPARIHLVQISN